MTRRTPRTRRPTAALLAIAALLAAGCGEGTPADPAEKDAGPEIGPPKPLTVMSFNILCSFCNLDEYDPWAERLPYFKDLFTRHDADLYGLQELTPLQTDIDDMLALFPDYGAVYYAPEDDYPYPDAMIFYRKSRFDVLESGDYWLSPTPDVARSTGFVENQLSRLVIWAKLRDRAGDRELYFANTHFDNNSPSQELSAPLVMERAAPWQKTHPVVMLGDFNSQPADEAFLTMTQDTSGAGFAFTDAQTIAKEWHIDTNQDPPPPYDHADRIDHVFLAGQAEWSVPSWVVDFHTYGPKNRLPSDHEAIVSVLDYQVIEP